MISIVVPVYNCEKYIKRCIGSIVNQTYKNIECIVIDDGSTDKTYEICNVLALKDGRIKVYHQHNCGVQKARETGITKCNGKYVMFVDADDYIEESILASAKAELEREKADIVCFNYSFQNRMGFHINRKEVIDSNTALKYMLTLNKLDGNLWCKLYRLDLVKNIKFEERLHCNFITCAEIIGRASRIAIIPEIGYFYSIIEGSITHYKKCNPRIAEYERTAYEYYLSVKGQNNELELEAEFFWLRSLLWINIKLEKESTLKRKDIMFLCEKKLLRKNIKRYFEISYFCLFDKVQCLLCYFNIFRIINLFKNKLKNKGEKENARV